MPNFLYCTHEESSHVAKWRPTDAHEIGFRMEMHAPTYYGLGVALFTFTSLLSQPFTLVKRREQMGTLAPNRVPVQLRAIYRAEGFLGLWRSAGVAWVPGVARMVYFTLYERVAQTAQQSIGCERTGARPLSLAVAGSSCTLVFLALNTPVSVVSSRLQLHQGAPLSAWTVAQDVLRKHKGRVGVFWTGYVSTASQLVPQQFTMWAVYAACAGLVPAARQQDLTTRLLCSLVGSWVAVAVTSPIDAIRTHRQAMVSDHSITTSDCKLPSSWRVAQLIRTKFGWRGFFRGLSARAIAACPGMMGMMVGYEYVKIAARHVHGQSDKFEQHT